MNKQNNSQIPAVILAARAVLKEFQEKHAVFKDSLPLAIGIDKQLLVVYPDMERKILRSALRMHTASSRYLRNMEKAVARCHLDGSPAEEITAEHRAHATGLLSERRQREVERMKAERASVAAAAAAAEAEAEARLRAEKLEQLAAKFARK